MSDPNALNALKRPLLLAAAAVALLVGLFMAFKGWQDSRGATDTQNVAAVRDRLHGELGSRLTDSQARFASLGEDRFLRADIAAGEFDAAAQRLREAWPALIAADAYAGTLDDVYAEEAATVGYGKLAVLSAAVLETSPVLGVVGPASAARLGMASALRDGEQIIAVIYGELPIDLLVVPLNESTADGGYIELRAGQTVLARQGDEALRPVAISRPLAMGGLTLATATPVAETSEGLDPMLSFGAAVVALLLAGGLFVASRRTGTAVVADDGEVTMADVLKGRGAAPTAAPADKPVASAKPEPEKKPATTVDRSIFRAYDIRGVVGKTLDEGVARLIGQAVGSLMRERGLREIVVGRDGRLSGPQLVAALIDGLRRAGCDVIDIGMAPTPLVYFATYQLNTGSGIAVTGSHNPPDYNGFKIMVGGDTLSGDAITDLYERIVENRLVSDGKGGLQQMSMAADYVSRVASDIQLERRMRVVIDAGNGVAGALAPELLEAIGADAEALYCDVDGTFPNHHPDPSDPANLADLITAVQRTGAELGLAFDGDGDRLGVVTRSGEVIYPDRLLMLFAQDVLSRNPGATVIYDVKCTGHLAGQILRHGGSPIMWKTGHSLIKSKMKETEAELAGEMSGHFFFRERWFGFDDGIYSAARLLEILAADEREPEEIFAELPKGVSTPELKIEMVEGEHYAFIERFRAQAKFDGAKIVTIDGIRADWPDGWGLVRCSNTTPSLVLRFDADNEAALARIQALFRAQLRALDPTLKLPF